MSDHEIRYRRATGDDLDAVVRMFAEDILGAGRERYEQPLPASYHAAFDAIDRDDNNELVVAESGGEVIAVLQITYIPNLTYQGSWRALIEGVHVASDHRGKGIGGDLIRHAIERARARGCRIVQLTTNKVRGDAKRFYERLGFVATHEGMKMDLGDDPCLTQG